MKLSLVTTVLTVAIPFLPLHSETVKDREGSVREDKATMEKDTRWIYNDWEKGLAEGKRTGKPVLVVLRCVPCLACAGIDSQVLLQETDLVPLLNEFVCVRVINANALDLSRFQFDYDLSFTTMFFNGDGTIYGRYGSWTHQKNPQDKTTAGYKEALMGALAIHRGYPGNRASLEGKQGAPTPFQSPLEIPGLAGKYERTLNWSGKVVQSCVHCHQVGDAMRTSLRNQQKPIPEELIYPQPSPESIGLSLAADKAATISAVSPDSAASRAGLMAGDQIVSLAGQPLISSADLSWALHRAPATGSLPMMIQRQGAKMMVQLPLDIGWRQHADISRRVGTWEMRAMSTGGILMEDLSDADRAERKLGTTDMALRLKHVGQYGKHAAAHKAGFKKDDIIVQLDGAKGRATESEIIGRLLLAHHVGDTIKATVLRGEQRLNLEWPIQ